MAQPHSCFVTVLTNSSLGNYSDTNLYLRDLHFVILYLSQFHYTKYLIDDIY